MWKKGVGRSRETCDKISASMKNKKQKASHIKNAADARRGFKQSTKQKEKAREMRSKTYLITAPNGAVTIIKNMTEFCRRNNVKYRKPIQRAIRTGQPYKGFYFRLMG